MGRGETWAQRKWVEARCAGEGCKPTPQGIGDTEMVEPQGPSQDPSGSCPPLCLGLLFPF